MSLAEDLQARLGELPNVRLAVLFGSQARGRAGAGSDIDIGLVLDSDTSAERRAVESELSEVVRQEVDVVYLDDSPPLLRFEVARCGQLLLERSPNAWSSFKARAMIDWWDWAPVAREIHRRARERLTGSQTHG